MDVDYKKAFEWYEKAAEQGFAGAQYNLGAMYEVGQGVDQSDSMAMRWYEDAAAQGHKNARKAISGILERRKRKNTGTVDSGGRSS